MRQPSPFPPHEPVIFCSRHHPDGQHPGVVVARRMSLPLALCTLPVMVGALVSALESASLYGWLWLGFPSAMLVAFLWTRFRLGVDVGEVHVRADRAAIRTLWETLSPSKPLRWLPIIDLRRVEHGLVLTLGRTPHALRFTDWPEAERMLSALQAARG